MNIQTNPDTAPLVAHRNSWGYTNGCGKSTYCETGTFPLSQNFMGGKCGAVYHRGRTLCK